MKSTQVAPVGVRHPNGESAALLQSENVVAENRILRAHVPARVQLFEPQRSTLAKIAKRLGRETLREVASVRKPEPLLAWYRKLTARKFDVFKARAYPGRLAVSREGTELVVRMARENTGWRYDLIAGALKNLGHCVSDQTVGNILRPFGITPAPKCRRQMTWTSVIRSHVIVLAGIDFFTIEVLTWRALATYYVLFFLHLETARVMLAEITHDPTEEWMMYVARHAAFTSPEYARCMNSLILGAQPNTCRGEK